MTKRKRTLRDIGKINEATGFPHGSIGDMSIRLGQDVRELIISGKSWAEINEMLRKKEAKQKPSTDH
ncbi:MAG: hypothetical protein AAF614_09440 [Chloroflexota bacterium]